MKILISPAKSINESCTFPTKEFTQPVFAKEAKQLVNCSIYIKYLITLKRPTTTDQSRSEVISGAATKTILKELQESVLK